MYGLAERIAYRQQAEELGEDWSFNIYSRIKTHMQPSKQNSDQRGSEAPSY